MRVLEESRAVVENEVNSSELLPRLEEDPSACPEEDAVPAITEAVCVGGLADFFFLLEVEANLVEIELNNRVVHRGPGETRERLGGIGITATLNKVSRGLEDGLGGEEKGRRVHIRTSGRKNMPDERTAAQMNWMAMGMRYEEWSARLWVELLTTEAKSRPMVMAHW